MPGSRGGYVLVSDAVKRARPDDAPFPAGLVADPAAEAAAPAETGDDAPAETPAKEEE